jgi:hypothetical protein
MYDEEKNWHLYTECFDDTGIYFEGFNLKIRFPILRWETLRTSSIPPIYGELCNKIPQEVWEKIRNFTMPLHLAQLRNMSEEQIKEMVTKQVNKRIELVDKKSEIPFGDKESEIYGDANNSIETQIEDGLTYYKLLKEKIEGSKQEKIEIVETRYY